MFRRLGEDEKIQMRQKNKDSDVLPKPNVKREKRAGIKCVKCGQEVKTVEC